MTYKRPGRNLLAISIASAIAIGGAIPGTAHAGDDLSTQTRIVGGIWKQARPVLDVQNPLDDVTFYDVPEGANIETLEPGTVLRERTLDYHVATFPTPLKVTQVLYVTTNILGDKEQNVTSVIHPPGGGDGSAISYQSFYDSSNVSDNPSKMIAGNFSLGGLLPAFETVLMAPAFANGHAVIVPDTQGKDAAFAAGPAYGTYTLDALRAATAATTSPVGADGNIGLFGYSGGAIATNWALVRLSSYAPELENRIVGAAQGGMFVNPENNLEYAGEGFLWSGVVGQALASLTKAYDIDVSEFFSDYGVRVIEDSSNLSIVEAQARYPRIRWQDLAKPEYPTPRDVPPLKAILDDINTLNWEAPRIPMSIYQGAGGQLELTPESPTQGGGDGVMVVNDVRKLVQRYCDAGTPVQYQEFEDLSHILAHVPWLVDGYDWLLSRMNGAPVTSNCGHF